MTRNKLLITAALLILAAFPLIVVGFQNESSWIWGAGLVLLSLAMVLSFLTRWADNPDMEEKEQEKE